MSCSRSSASRSVSVAPSPLRSFAASSACSKASPGTSITILPNIWMNRRYASRANRSVAAGLLGQALQRLVVEAEVQDGVHHAGHRELGAGPHAHEQRVGRVAEPLAHRRLERLHVLLDLVHQAVGEAALGQVGEARLGRDREPVRDRQAHVRHLGEVGALAAEQVLHVLVAFREVVDVLGHGMPPARFERFGAVSLRPGSDGSAEAQRQSCRTTGPSTRESSVQVPSEAFGDVADQLTARPRPAFRAQAHRRGEHVSARVIVVVHLFPPGPQSRERLGCDLFGGDWVEGHQGTCPHDPRYRSRKNRSKPSRPATTRSIPTGRGTLTPGQKLHHAVYIGV